MVRVITLANSVLQFEMKGLAILLVSILYTFMLFWLAAIIQGFRLVLLALSKHGKFIQPIIQRVTPLLFLSLLLY